MERIAAVVPIKTFREAKGRLRTELGDSAASDLAQKLARGVLESLRPLPTVVVTDDEAVAAFATGIGVEVLRQSKVGLNAAVSEGYDSLRGRTELVVIVHSDLAHPEGLATYRYDDGITIWTDRDEQGTNVMCLPAGLDFTFSYGVGSAPLHRSVARELGIEPRWIAGSQWALDIDEPSDLRQ